QCCEQSAPAISPDGRYVTFESSADNLVPGVTGDEFYLRDLDTGTTTLLTPSVSGGGGASNGAGAGIAFSGDSHHVVFFSDSTDLASNPVTGTNLYERNLQTNQTVLVSADLAGLGAGVAIANVMGDSVDLSVSADGRRVVFLSSANTYVNGDTKGNVE